MSSVCLFTCLSVYLSVYQYFITCLSVFSEEEILKELEDLTLETLGDQVRQHLHGNQVIASPW